MLSVGWSRRCPNRKVLSCACYFLWKKKNLSKVFMLPHLCITAAESGTVFHDPLFSEGNQYKDRDEQISYLPLPRVDVRSCKKLKLPYGAAFVDIVEYLAVCHWCGCTCIILQRVFLPRRQVEPFIGFHDGDLFIMLILSWLTEEYSLDLIINVDGARLDEFSCDSGTSGFIKFATPQDCDEDTARRCAALCHSREMVPIFGVAVQYGKQSKDTKKALDLTNPTADYMYELLRRLTLLCSEQQIPYCTPDFLYRKVHIRICAMMGDYPSLTRYVNTRHGRCPFCWYGQCITQSHVPGTEGNGWLACAWWFTYHLMFVYYTWQSCMYDFYLLCRIYLIYGSRSVMPFEDYWNHHRDYRQKSWSEEVIRHRSCNEKARRQHMLGN